MVAENVEIQVIVHFHHFVTGELTLPNQDFRHLKVRLFATALITVAPFRMVDTIVYVVVCFTDCRGHPGRRRHSRRAAADDEVLVDAVMRAHDEPVRVGPANAIATVTRPVVIAHAASATVKPVKHVSGPFKDSAFIGARVSCQRAKCPFRFERWTNVCVSTRDVTTTREKRVYRGVACHDVNGFSSAVPAHRLFPSV